MGSYFGITYLYGDTHRATIIQIDGSAIVRYICPRMRKIELAHNYTGYDSRFYRWDLRSIAKSGSFSNVITREAMIIRRGTRMHTQEADPPGPLLNVIGLIKPVG